MSFKTLARLGPFQLQRIVRDPVTYTPSDKPIVSPPRDVAGLRMIFPVWGGRRRTYDPLNDHLGPRAWQWFILALTFSRRDAPQVATSLTWGWMPRGGDQ